MNQDDFKEALLGVMERKEHWAWPAFTSGLVPKNLLHHHFEQEYEVYVRDFPILIGWAYVQCPIAEVRQELAENLYEEETGGIQAGAPHPELFLRYPKGLGMDLSRFSRVELLPAARAYRQYLDRATQGMGWEVAAAVSTLFIEGTAHERGEIDPAAPKRPAPPLAEHPLVKHYGLPLEDLALTKAHRQVEGEHRGSAWRVLLDHVGKEHYAAVVAALEGALQHWQSYRDEVAQSCGIERDSRGQPAVTVS
ncbi:MAG: iron-containing redox enzyme family protein [Myxococcales bacterium]|nr:iron-containing redox enzyme family protein [Myxococcales bacterium]